MRKQRSTSGVKRNKLVAALIAGLVLTSCATLDTDGAADSEREAVQLAPAGFKDTQKHQGTPVPGGTLTVAEYTLPVHLDPTKLAPSGTAGGITLAAVYDVLMRYDAETKDYVPHLAQSLEAGEDGLSWTLKIRDGVTFSDGTPFDADAVAWSINKHLGEGAGFSQLMKESITSIETPDSRTVVFKLSRPWAGFPGVLSQGPGMILAPSSEVEGRYLPVGAGPFTVDKISPNESIELKARAGYWGGEVHLEGVKSIAIQGAAATVDSLVGGSADMGLVIDPEQVERLIASELPGYIDIANLSSAVAINNREGRPGADIRVRQAISLALDRTALNQRVYKGAAAPSGFVYSQFSSWNDGGEPQVTDVEEARRLLDSAKADGYDGQITYTAAGTPENEALSLYVATALKAVGFDVENERLPGPDDIRRQVFAEHDFDIAGAPLMVHDDDPFMRVYGALNSNSAYNTSGYKSPAMDQFLRDFQAAGTDEEKRAAAGKIQELFVAEVPFAALAAANVITAWRNNVHGVNHSVNGIFLLSDAWMTE